MVISPLDNTPVFIDTNSKVIPNTTRPPINQSDIIPIGLPSVPLQSTPLPDNPELPPEPVNPLLP